MFQIDIPPHPFEKVMRGVLASFDRKAETDRKRSNELVRIATAASDANSAKVNRIFDSGGSI